MADAELSPDTPPPSLVRRMLVPASPARPATPALIAGALGAAAFVGSLLMDWQHLVVNQPANGSGPTGTTANTEVLKAGLGTVDTLSQVYVLGCIAMLGVAGAVLVRPEAALRIRLGATGVAVGLFGVLVALTVRMPETVFNIVGILNGFTGEDAAAIMARTKITYEPGVFYAFAAVALLTLAIWLASLPASRLIRARAEAEAGAPWAVVPIPVQADPGDWRPPRVVGSVGELSVSASEALDPAVTPESWSR
jgi:hypothetical protein